MPDELDERTNELIAIGASIGAQQGGMTDEYKE